MQESSLTSALLQEIKYLDSLGMIKSELLNKSLLCLLRH